MFILLSAAIAGGCGEQRQKRSAQQLENLSVLSKTTPLSERLIKPSEIATASNSAGVQTFLQLWSLLQFQAWDQAEQYFQPTLRSAIGPSLLAQGLAQDALMWQATKPKIVTATANGPTAVITFLGRSESGAVVPLSISFQQTKSGWRVSYFSALDSAIQRAVQMRTQAQIEPLATKPSAEAVRQGFAAIPLQSNYLERQLRGRAGAVP